MCATPTVITSFCICEIYVDINLVFTFGIVDATLPFHIEELVFRDQKLHISTNDTLQFLRLPFLADNVYSFTAFPNTMPGALPCLQTLSHWANFLLILFPSHSQLSVALGRCLLNWGKKKEKKRCPPLFSHYPFFPSLAPSCPLLFLSQQESERAFDCLLSTKGCTVQALDSQGQL